MQTSLRVSLVRVTQWIVPIAAFLALAAWMYIAPPGILGKMDALGYAVCHRIDERSFHVDGRQLPLCARCSGTFTAAFVGLAFQAIVARRRAGLPPKRIIIPLALFFLAFAVDGANSYLYLLKETTGELAGIPNLYVPNNTLRLFTGSGMGLAMSLFIYPAFNQSVWRDADFTAAIGTWKPLAALVGIMLALDFAILTESPLVLYPIAILSPLGTLALLAMVFTIAWIMVMRQENSFVSFHQLWLALSAGFTLAMILVLGIDLFRLQLTGTWGGFPLG